MKYTIEGFNQVELVKMGLNSNDAVILRWFVDFYATNKMTVVKNKNGQEFRWVKYQAVIDDLPILGITSRDVIARHFNKMVTAGIIEKHTHRQMGVFSCFRITDKFNVLIEKNDQPTEKSTASDSKVGTPPDSKVETKDHSIKENHSIKQEKKFTPPTKEEADAYCKQEKLNVDTFKFIKYYAAADWKIKDGKKMKNWKQALARWHVPTPEQERRLKARETAADIDRLYKK